VQPELPNLVHETSVSLIWVTAEAPPGSIPRTTQLTLRCPPPQTRWISNPRRFQKFRWKLRIRLAACRFYHCRRWIDTISDSNQIHKHERSKFLWNRAKRQNLLRLISPRAIRCWTPPHATRQPFQGSKFPERFPAWKARQRI